MKTCSSCQFYQVTPQDMSQGACHCHVPTPLPLPGAGGQILTMSLRPVVKATDAACEKFRAKGLDQ